MEKSKAVFLILSWLILYSLSPSADYATCNENCEKEQEEKRCSTLQERYQQSIQVCNYYCFFESCKEERRICRRNSIFWRPLQKYQRAVSSDCHDACQFAL